MKKTQELKTLGDYRRAAKNPKFAKDAQFSLSKLREGNNASHYHAIRVALKSAHELITFAQENTLPFPEYADPWEICFGNSEYRMKNYQLFCAIRLMEFVNIYKEVHSIDELHQGWHERPDAGISVFNYAGLSYLEATFIFVRFFGNIVAGELQNAYLRCKKLEGKVDEVFSVLKNTHQTDNLQICPEPDESIRLWFDEIVKWTQKWIQKYDLSKGAVEKEFNRIFKQLEYEWNTRASKNLMTSKLIIKHFEVSPATLRRYVKDNKLTDYREKPHSKNAMLILDAVEVARWFGRKPYK